MQQRLNKFGKDNSELRLRAETAQANYNLKVTKRSIRERTKFKYRGN